MRTYRSFGFTAYTRAARMRVRKANTVYIQGQNSIDTVSVREANTLYIEGQNSIDTAAAPLLSPKYIEGNVTT